MSRRFTMDPDDYDDYEDDYEDDYSDHEEGDYDGNEEEEEQKPASVDLFSLATVKQKSQPQKASGKQKPNSQEQKKNKKKKNAFSLDDELPTRANVKIVDASEKEYYDSLLVNPNDKNEKKRALDSVHFLLAVQTSVMINWDRHKSFKFTLQHLTVGWAERYNQMYFGLENINKKREQSGMRRINNYQQQYMVTDAKGNPLPKFTKKTFTIDSLDHDYLQHCLKRINFAATSVNGIIWVHGGFDGKSVLSDFWSYDPVANHFTLFQNIEDRFEIQIPPMQGHKMIHVTAAGEDKLLILGENNQRTRYRYGYYAHPFGLFLISNITNTDEIHLGTQAYSLQTKDVHFAHPDHRSAGTDDVPPRVDFSAVVISDVSAMYEILIFGGRRSKGNSTHGIHTMYQISIAPGNIIQNGSNPYPLYAPKHIPKLRPDDHWPAPRFGHAAMAVNGNMLIFGGRHMHKYYNDMHMYNVRDQKWTEIDIKGSIPPALVYAGCFSYSVQTMYIHGGLKADGRASDSLYAYNTGTQTWNVVKVLGHGSNANSSAKDLQTPLHSMECVTCDNQMFRIGGKYLDRVVCEISSLSNIQDPGSEYSLSLYLKKLRSESTFSDVVFRVKELHDSEKTADQMNEADVIHEYFAHRCVLFARCKHLTELVNESTNIQEIEDGNSDSFSSAQKVIVDIEDCNAVVFDAYLHFLYSGEVLLSGLSNILQLLAICEKWSPDVHFPLIAEICNVEGNTTLEVTERVLAQFASDFEKLIDNPESFTDLTLTLGGSTDEPVVMSVHKSLICRSDFFRSMLLSGMQESYADNIDLLENNKSIMLEIIRFCYTDQIHLTTDNAIGLMITSAIFNLPAISNSCRNLVGQCLTLDNVCEVMEIAETYSDNALKRLCYPFMRVHYDDLIHVEHFHTLTAETRLKVQDMALKHKKKQQKK